MGDNEALIVQILAVVLILFFCFVTYMNTKTWRATHVTFLFLVFGAALVFAVYASLILKTRKAWQKAVADLEKSVAQQTDANEKQLYGTRTPKEAGLADWRHANQLAIIDRGNVWRDCAFTGAEEQAVDPETGDATVVVRLNTTPPGNQGEKVEPNKMVVDTVVYAFKDLDPNLPHTSYVYIGEFKATGVTDTTITLESTMPLPKSDRDLIPGNQPWILYERMPTDSQLAFRKPKDLFFPEINPADVLKVDDPSILWEYERDGMSIEEVRKDRQAKMQPPLTKEQEEERTFAEVKFLKDYTFDVDAAEAAFPPEGTNNVFDSAGKALDPRLRRGSDGKVTLKAGDTAEIILHGHRGDIVEKGATELAEEGVLEIIREVYRRPLNDYAYAFRHIAARRNQMIETLRLLDYELNVLKDEIAAAEKNTMARQQERGKLNEDQTQLTAEKEKITKYAQELEASYRGVRAELSRLYRENSALHDRIVVANEQLTRDIEARTATPTALEE